MARLERQLVLLGESQVAFESLDVVLQRLLLVCHFLHLVAVSFRDAPLMVAENGHLEDASGGAKKSHNAYKCICIYIYIYICVCV